MNSEFARSLNTRGILIENTKIFAKYKGYTLDGTRIDTRGELLIRKINFHNNSIESTPLFGHNKYTIKFEDVMEVDGMDPERLGRVFNINSDGSERPIGKKRGRKSKKTLME